MTLDLSKIQLNTLEGGEPINDPLLPQVDPLRATLSEAVKTNPDTEMKIQKLSQDSGVPAFAVQSNPAEVETALKLKNINLETMNQRSPNTSAFLTDYNNAVIAHDDINVLESLEQLFRFDRTFENVGKTTKIGFQEQAAGVLLAGADRTANQIVDLIPPSALPIGVSDYSYQLSYQLADRMGIQTDEELQAAKEAGVNRLIDQLKDLQGQRQALTPDDLNLLEQGVRSGVESLVNMAPGFALTLLSAGRAAPLLVTMGTQTFGSSYGSARADGEDPTTAAWYASIDAAIEVGTEVLPTGTIERVLTGKSTGLKKDALKFMVQEMGTEQLATLGQSLNAYAFGLDEELEKAESLEEMMQIQLQRQAVTAIATVVAGGAQATIATGIRKTVDAATRNTDEQINQGEIEQQRIDQINQQSESSKLRERDRERFRQFVGQSDGDQNTSVFIDGAQVSLYLNSKSRQEIDADPALQKLQEQVGEASRLGIDVSIPVADFAADIAGTEHYEALRDHMTMSAESVTPFRQEQVREETQSYIQGLMQEAEQNVSEYVQAQDIYETVKQQLTDTGMVTPQNAGVMAQVVPAWATVYAKKNGISVQEAYQNSGLVIEGPQTGRMAELTGEQVLTQGSAEQRNLFVAHNLSAENLLAASDLGGLAAPSIAVGRTDTGFGDFGEITLLADPSLLTSPKIRTFDADIYSPRQPRAVYDLNSKNFRDFTSDLAPSDMGLSTPDIESASEGPDALLRSDAVRYKFLEQQGKLPKLKNAKVEPAVKQAAKLKGNRWQLIEDPKFIRIAEKHYRSMLDKVLETDPGRAERYSGFWFEEDGSVKPSKIQDFASEVDRYKSSGGKDVGQFRADLRDKFNNKKLSAEYEQWVTDQYNNMVDGKSLFKGFTPSGNRKYVPYTMENVVKEMTQQLQAGESFFYGAGTVRSAYANEMRTIGQIQARRDQIVPADQMEKVKEESSKALEDALEKLKPFYKYDADSWNYAEDAGSAIAEGPKGIGEAFNLTAESRQIIGDLVDYLRGLPTSYFEAKAQRPVQFSEFNTAVVPKGTRKDALQVLRDAGLKIKTYDPKIEGSRAEVIAQQQNLLFQRQPQVGPEQARGYYDPANSMIRLTESADLSTFLHEFAHFMYEMEIKAGGETVQSIHNWYHRNADDVAKEASGYLRDQQRGDLEQSAFHGTPHKFDRFSLDAIGTGEGAQAYGWGLYFAGKKGIAEFYRDSIGGFKVDGKEMTADSNEIKGLSGLASSALVARNGDVDAAIDYARTSIDPEVAGELSRFDRGRIQKAGGNIYQVDIPESDQLLDWDEPLSEQEMLAIYDNMQQTALTQFAMDFQDNWYRRMEAGRPAPDGQDLYTELSKELGGDRAASEYLNSIGIPGLRYLDATARGQQDGDSHNYVIWDEQAVTVEAVNDELVQAEQFAQSPEIPGEIPAGSVTADDVRNYLDTGSTGNKQVDNAIRRAVHEQFARGFETYLMEGKAPSIELRNAFRSFARWLVQIYQRIKGDLKVNLDPEMRQVFDRMLATEEQIAAAEVRAQYAPMFTDATMAGMTAEEWQDYQKRQEKVKDKQTETLREKLITELTRTTKKWWKDEKQDIADDERQRLSTERVYVARERLRSGDIKLDRATVKEMVGEDVTDKRGRTFNRVPPALSGMHVTGGEGVHPDEAAAFFGYGSGSEMLVDLMSAPSLKDAADQRAEEIMKERHGDILNDGTIEQQADEAVQNEERGRMMLHELKILSRGTNARSIERDAVKQLAADRISKLSYREIHPGKYRKAEIKAAQEAARMLAEGNREGAAQAKSRQVVNYYLGMAATEARNNTTKIVDRMARYNKKSVREEIMKAGNEYWEQLEKILARFEFRKSATLRQVEQINQDINSWMRNRIDQDGDALVLTPAVLNESYVTHWKNVPYAELQGISDSVRNIEHVARYSNKITRLQEEMDFKTLVDKWVTSMDAKVKTAFKPQRTDVVEGRRWGRWAMAQMTKVPYLASWLDGGERAGLSHQILVQPFTDAYDAELQMWREVGNPVLQAIEQRSKADIKRHNRKVFIPEIKDANNDGNLFGHQILAVALNTGNQSNLKKMLLGEGWANPEIESEISFDNIKLQAVLKHMTRSDWQMVQMIWDRMEMLYPQLAEVHRKTTGLTPPKIEATPISIQIDGETMRLRGGYYPVKYDPNRSQRAQENEDKLNAETESMFSGQMSIQASVNAGATNERTGYYAPIRLSLDVVPSHFQETIHYITHHDAVREVNKLIRNPSVAKMISEKLGPEEFAQLRPWLNDIAKDGREAPAKMFWDSMLQRLRFGVTLGAMGFKASTGIMQLLGLSNTVAEVGLGNTAQAARSILGSTTTMKQAWEFASSNSKVLNHRAQTMDREIKNALQRVEGKRGILAAVQEASMKHIALIQTYMVDLPSWYAAYTKGMKDHGDETRAYQYADWVVENIQGSGATKDMARIMRGQTETGRMFTMFMTFFSSLWNMERDLARGARSGAYSITNVAAKSAFIFFIPVFLEMLLRGEFGGDDDDEESALQTYLLKTAIYPVQSVPFVRDIANAVTGDYGYNITPMQQILEQGTRTIPEIVTRGFTDEEITKGQIKGATKFIGAATGIPGTGQAWATGEHLYDVLAEGEDLTMRELLFGPKKD